MTDSSSHPLDIDPLDIDPLDIDPLDNMAWHSLTGPQAALAEAAPTSAPARRFRRSVAPFSAVARLDGGGWAALAELVGVGGVTIQFRAEVPAPPPGWTEVSRDRTVQYVAGDLPAPDPDLMTEVVELGEADGRDMQALVTLTRPGPFSAETWRCGRYFGLRRDGRLMAMAGERLRAPGWGEISAVCVHPDGRGQGLGEIATLAAAAAISARGDRPMLHVAEANEPAHRLYLRLGFEVRRDVEATAHRWLG